MTDDENDDAGAAGQQVGEAFQDVHMVYSGDKVKHNGRAVVNNERGI